MAAALFVVLGLALLVAGGELLVRGASTLAERLGVSRVIIGLTVVAAGTSMPELVVSIDAAMAGKSGLTMGNIVGSNIFNVAAILGVAAVIAPLAVQGSSVKLEWPVMVLACFLLHLLARDGAIDRLEGGFFAFGLVAFVAYLVRLARSGIGANEAAEIGEVVREVGGGRRVWMRASLAILGGGGLLVGGAECLVRGAVDIAAAAGVSDAVIGLTVVAAGTSLPELATSAIASFRGQNDIAVANVIGSNIFNVLAIVGVTALIVPIPVPAAIVGADTWWMIGFAVLLLPLMRTGYRISRIEGVLLLAGFGLYLGLLLGR